MKTLLALAALLMAASPLAAQETRSAAAGQAPPPARVADLAWLAGTWAGDGISGPAREVYSVPLGGQIAGHFIQSQGEGIAFYEFVTIAETNGSLEYRIKHFNADHTGWEERNQVQRYPLVAIDNGAAYFDGLTLRRDGEDGLVSAVRVRGNGGDRELVFRYRRVR